MRLATRLILLIVLCMLPLLATAIYAQIDLRDQRQSQLGELAMRQAELINGDLTSIIDGARQFAHAVSEFPSVQRLADDCGGPVVRLNQGLPEYKFVAVFKADGSLVCSSLPGLRAASGAQPPWLAELLPSREFTVGRFAVQNGVEGPFLPIVMPLFAADALPPKQPDGQVVVALDLDWLAHHLEALTLIQPRYLANSTLIVADRGGVVLGRFPDSEREVGQPVEPGTKALFLRGGPETAKIRGADGRVRLAAVIPDTVPPFGLAAMVALYAPDLTTDVDHTTELEALLIIGSFVLAMVIAIWAARRFVSRPTDRLIASVRRWQAGDLSSRADVAGTSSEFGRLGQALNAMASGLQARDLERRLQAELLDAQLLKRTRELSDSNNRLQVEIAEREKAETALHQAHKLQALGQLAGGVAHDFNNMLATILGNLELIERRLPTGNPAEHERMRALVERATGAVQRGAQLTSRLLAFSRRQRQAPRATDLNRLVADMATLAGSTLGHRIQMTTELDPELWPCMVDHSQLEAAILNLCLNARDAMPEGGRVTITTSNAIIATTSEELAAGEYIRLAVADTGTGMTVDVQQRATEPFFTTKTSGGSGLGLSQVYGLARQTGGTLRIKTAPGEGTEITLLLPRSAADIEMGGHSRRVEPAERLGSSLALVVDDDPAVRQVTADMLRDLGCEVLETSGDEEALAVIDNPASPVSLVLLDYAMPGMNGIQLAKKMRERGVLAPIILATGYAELADPPEDFATLLDGLLRKPFTIRELRAVLGRVQADALLGSNVVPLRSPRRE